jgi:SAM-dependent methyltransferase
VAVYIPTASLLVATQGTVLIAPGPTSCGCGTGRVLADVAELMPGGGFFGVDLSKAKLDLASRTLLDEALVETNLSQYGFPRPLSIRGRALSNVVLAQAVATALPIKSVVVDVVASINLLDRVKAPQAVLNEAKRVLRGGGHLVLTTPLNWDTAELWAQYPDAESLLELVQSCGFSIERWFDQLIYRETLDVRGSVEEFTTLAISAVRVGN